MEIPVVTRIGADRLVELLGNWQTREPYYLGLANSLRRAVLSGSLPVGTRIPSERELARAAGKSRTTIAMAYQQLRDEGFLVSRQGSGSVLSIPTRGSDHGLAGLAPAGYDETVTDLRTAAPPAPTLLATAAEKAAQDLPVHLSGRGYEPHGFAPLREAVANRYRERDLNTGAEQVLITTGAQQALSLVLSALLSPGDRVLIQHPTYPNAIKRIRELGARPVPVPVNSDGIDVALLEASLRQTSPRALYVIPDFHNPTGISLSPEARLAVRELTRRYETALIVDESLVELNIDQPTVPSPLALGHRAAVTVGSAAKTFWGGLRVGWVRAAPEMVSRLMMHRVTSDISTSLMDQLITTHLLADNRALREERRRRLRKSRDTLLLQLREHLPTWVPAVPSGGLVVWVDMGAPVASAMASLALRHRILIAPGTAFGLEGNFEQYLRLSFGGASAPAIQRALPGLRAAWESLAGGSVGVTLTPVV